jgi:hypothetical protein
MEAEGYSPANAQERSGEDILRNFQGPFMLFMVMFRMLFVWRPPDSAIRVFSDSLRHDEGCTLGIFS